MNETKTYIFFGNVGAGKGTQVFLLKDLLEKITKEKVVYVYPGEKFRKLIEGEGYTNTLAAEILNRGNLLPLFLVSSTVSDTLVENLKSAQDHIIMDGFPRSLDQVKVFESVIDFYARVNPEIIYIKISKREAVKRLKQRGRHDDTEEGIMNRFDEYEKNVLPALDLLKEKGYSVYEINGEQHIDEVNLDIKKALGLMQ